MPVSHAETIVTLKCEFVPVRCAQPPLTVGVPVRLSAIDVGAARKEAVELSAFVVDAARDSLGRVKRDRFNDLDLRFRSCGPGQGGRLMEPLAVSRYQVATPFHMKALFSKTSAAALLAVALLLGAGCSREGKTAGQVVDDSAISAKVKASFAKDPGVRAIDILVDTHLGAVQLSGWANSPEEKARAEELAKTIPGVKSVENKIALKTDIKKG